MWKCAYGCLGVEEIGIFWGRLLKRFLSGFGILGGLAFCFVMWLRNEVLEGSANLCEIVGYLVSIKCNSFIVHQKTWCCSTGF
jgi:hypothetical protein